MVGLVVVSHSRALATAAVAMAREMAQGSVRIEIAAGLDEQTLGTDAAAIATAVAAADDGVGVVVLMDVGSAVLSADLACELLDEPIRSRVRLSPAPLVEGLLVAAVAAAGGAAVDDVLAEAAGALAGKQAEVRAPADTRIETRPAARIETPHTARIETPHTGPVGTADEHTATTAGTGTDHPSEERVARFTIRNAHGLHARPAARLVRDVRRFDAAVTIRNLTTGSDDVPAASLSRLATLGALRGHVLELRATGRQADASADSILALAHRGFDEPAGDDEPSEDDEPGEDVEPLAPAAGRRATAAPSDRPSPGSRLVGVPAAPGIAIGPAWTAATARPDVHDLRSDDPPRERRHLAAAITAVQGQLQTLQVRTSAEVGYHNAAVFEAHLLLLEDPALLDAAGKLIDQGSAAPAAWAAVVDETERAFEAMADPYLRARAADVRAVGDQVTRELLGATGHPAGGRGVLIAADLTPAEAAALDPDRALAVVLAFGSPTSHAAILAGARGIPTVVAVGPAVLQIPEGTEVAVNAATGDVEVEPDERRRSELAGRVESATRERADAVQAAAQPARTRNKTLIPVGANIASDHEARLAVRCGADLAGLVRTELVFLEDRLRAPDVDEQITAYLALATAMEGRRLTLRTLDVGGDKPLPYIPHRAEANPFLGVRGLRLSLALPDLLRDQLRAIVRVARQTPVSVLFPMVSCVDELLQARRVLDQVISSEGRGAPAGLEVGIMVEVPAVAHKIAAFAPHVDFLSVGTNDLTQYALAAERGNAALARLADPYDPGVLALIRVTCAAAAGGPRVAVCGELAADPRAAALLVGMGVQQLSVPPAAVPEVKQAVRAIDQAAAEALAAAAVTMPGPAEVLALLRDPVAVTT